MTPDILSYIKSERVCVLAVEMMDGSPHAATVHYANSDAAIFVFETARDYRKAEPLFGRDSTRASMAIGSTEGTMKTLQLDGEVRLLSEDEEHLRKLYVEKFPEKQKKLVDPKIISFVFTPTWWRFSDWTKPAGKTIVTSED